MTHYHPLFFPLEFLHLEGAGQHSPFREGIAHGFGGSGTHDGGPVRSEQPRQDGSGLVGHYSNGRRVFDFDMVNIQQALDTGELQADQLTRIWNTAGDERVRDFANGAKTSHRTMHNQERLVGVPFTSGAGNQALHPGAFGRGEEDVNCRCVVSTRIKSLSELPGILSVSIL